VSPRSLLFRAGPPAHALALVLLTFLPRPATAAWPSDPMVNLPLCTIAGSQTSPAAVSDAAGGAIVAWDDQRTGSYDIYVQRVDATGTPRWAAGGVALCAAPGAQGVPEIAPDGSGGAIVVWSDLRGANADLYAQRVDSTGTPLWTTNGVAICLATSYQFNPKLIPDDSGGAIITWEDNRTGNSKIYAQRVNANRVPQWTGNGVLLTTSLAGQARPIIVSNGAGGAIVAWEDVRNGLGDIYCMRILANGARDPVWPAAGRIVSLFLGRGQQESPAMVVDGAGGALVAWAWWDGASHDVHVQHVLASGALDPAWPANGRALIVDYFDQASPAMLPDGAGGAIVTWDHLQNPGNRDIYAQHVLASGAFDPAWPDSGVALTLDPANQMWPRMVPDGAGGALVTWHDLIGADGDIHAQHLMSTGEVDPAWPPDGRAISTAAGRQIVPVIVADGAGGAVLAWQDQRNETGEIQNLDIYAQGVKANGQLGDDPVDVPGEVPLGLALEAPRPNPTRTGSMLVRFTLPSAAPASLELFDVAGRRIVAREVGSLGPGHHAIDLTAGRRASAGVHFVRLLQGEGARVRRIVVLDE
jgi:hypothetical protein